MKKKTSEIENIYFAVEILQNNCNSRIDRNNYLNVNVSMNSLESQVRFQ